MHARTLAAILAVLVASGCADAMDPGGEATDAEATFANANASPNAADMRMYEVTVANLTGGQPLTPPLAVTHRRPARAREVPGRSHRRGRRW